MVTRNRSDGRGVGAGWAGTRAALVMAASLGCAAVAAAPPDTPPAAPPAMAPGGPPNAMPGQHPSLPNDVPAEVLRYVPVERPTHITAIAHVVAGNAKWEEVYSSVELQDGIVGAPDGGILIAQQDSDVVRKIDANNAQTIYLGNTHGAGALGMDGEGRLWAVHRKAEKMISVLAPEARVIAKSLPDGGQLGRLGDLVVDLKGGAYISGDFYYVSPTGVVTVLPQQDLQTNGIALSPDGKTLYVTNETSLVAFDVQADGGLLNRRVFGSLEGDTSADGMAIDGAGRVYVCAAAGIHVIGADGRPLGVIPTARHPTSVAFAGPGKKTLYVVEAAALKSDGTLLTPAEGANRTARTLYKLPMLAAGFKGRGK